MKIETSLGSLALKVAGKAKANCTEAIENQAALNLCYRTGASKLFGKKSGHSRDEAFSPKLMNDAVAALTEVLGTVFENIEITGAEYVKPESKVDAALKQAHDALAKTGVGEDVLKGAFPTLYVEPVAEVAAEPEKLKAA